MSDLFVACEQEIFGDFGVHSLCAAAVVLFSRVSPESKCVWAHFLHLSGLKGRLLECISGSTFLIISYWKTIEENLFLTQNTEGEIF